jgi:hypothetical protein
MQPEARGGRGRMAVGDRQSDVKRRSGQVKALFGAEGSTSPIWCSAARRRRRAVPRLLRGLVGLGFSTVIALPTPNASRVIALRDLADVEGARVVESYFDLAIRPQPPRGVVLFAPCSFNSLNKLAHGIADNLALSVVAEAIGRGTPVIVAPSLNAPLLAHPQAQASLKNAAELGRDHRAAGR